MVINPVLQRCRKMVSFANFLKQYKNLNLKGSNREGQAKLPLQPKISQMGMKKSASYPVR